ncbi:hypothetical protein G6F43_003241 [Rhizopus delemar]|nr:hypothetical protein G6F43_003241 [Rhizopus delemar]
MDTVLVPETLPEARRMCYRLLYDKLHSQGSVSRSTPDVSAACQLCQASIEDVNHLLAMCPFKWPIWQEVLSRFAPHF